MVKQTLILFVFFGICVFVTAFAQDESVTFTTYYPSPYGSYNEMRARRMAVGSTYLDHSQYCWSGDNCAASATIVDTDTSLIVEGNAGIGITSPGSKLTIKGTTADNTASALNITNSSDNSLFFVRNDGNVGIGRSVPLAKLDVEGGIRVGGDSICNSGKSGTLRYNGTKIQYCDASGNWSDMGGGDICYSIKCDLEGTSGNGEQTGKNGTAAYSVTPGIDGHTGWVGCAIKVYSCP